MIISQSNTPHHAAYPVDLTANVTVSGLIACAQIKQFFINPFDTELAAKYQFPMPENAAIKHLRVNIADKEILVK